MDDVDDFVRELPGDALTFRGLYPHGFLLRRPKVLSRRPEADSRVQTFEYRTRTVNTSDDSLLPWAFRVAVLQKREGNPFPDHLSVGRAPNCDVVLRFPYVSKLHARFLLRDGVPSSLEDMGSANGTSLNGKPLEAHVPRPLLAGDFVGFGSLVVEFVEPETFFEIARARRQAERALDEKRRRS